ncbi:amino acid efflux transporter [Hamadaea flava]|uniref:APC family permease n=1 Tax=Hamadaea flava TaxID=1742688 RepID=A0ABV8M0X0_9ACTN|nr:amino acid permease [Hamadaea flava]MCP2321976.1 amino acid efflux transporter [Hamadaea flava]
MTKTRLGVWAGTAMVLGGVLGPGMLVLPHLAATAAGPGAIVAWAGLVVVSVPVAITFARLGARLPGGGGVAHYAGAAFGRWAYALVGWWFFAAVPIGTLAGALAGGLYAATAFGWPGPATTVIAALVLTAAFAANAAGLRIGAKVQVGLLALLLVVLIGAIVASTPAVQAAYFEPFLPRGLGGVGRAVGVLMFAFVGWEAASHLSAEFSGKRLLTATSLTLAVMAVVYLGVAVTAAGSGAAASPVPLTTMLSTGIGRTAAPVTGVAALVLTFGAVNTYLAGASRLGAALAEQRLLPHRLARPGRSLLVMAAAITVAGVVTAGRPLDLDPLLRATSACLATVMALGTAAAVRLLRGPGRATAIAATALTSLTLALCGAYLVVPAAIAIFGGAVRAGFQKRLHSRPGTTSHGTSAGSARNTGRLTTKSPAR